MKVESPNEVRRVSTHAIGSEVEIKVGTIIMKVSKGNVIKTHPRSVIIGEKRMNMNKIALTKVRAQNQRGSASSPRVNDFLSRILDKSEGSDDLSKGMKDDFSSLNNKVNSHADTIKTLEGQLSLLTLQLKQKMQTDDADRGLAVVTRSGKEVKDDRMGNEEV
uniref:Integrase core domain containing protein n=1 Tax=Solanum tuberosum TaxID=4113 RepID=M1DNE9_SOLTU